MDYSDPVNQPIIRLLNRSTATSGMSVLMRTGSYLWTMRCKRIITVLAAQFFGQARNK